MDNCSPSKQLIAGLSSNSWVQHMLEHYFKNKISKLSEGHLNGLFMLLASRKTWNTCKWAADELLNPTCSGKDGWNVSSDPCELIVLWSGTSAAVEKLSVLN